MKHGKISRSFLGIALCTATLVFLAETPRVSAADGQGRIVNKVRKNRLPKYYANVVTQQQRDEINKIQEEYDPKIKALKTQLEALNKEMNEKISAVLTEEQKKKVEEAAAAAKAKATKEEKAADSAKPAEKTEKKEEKKTEK